MRFLKNVIDIITRRDIHWLELLILWITLCFFVTLLAPGNYFATSPQLHHLENTAYGLQLSERFWATIFGGLSFAQGLAILAGDTAIGIRLSRGKRLALSPYLVRMRALALGVGVWLAVAILIYPSAVHWHVTLLGIVQITLPVSLSVGIFSGLALFSFLAAIRMAAEVSVRRQDDRRREVLVEAAKYAAIYEEAELMYAEVQNTAEVQSPKAMPDTHAV